MSMPKAYAPEKGYKYQILCRHSEYNGREWEHCDYAKDGKEKNYLIGEYRMAYGVGYEFKSILLPEKYWAAFPDNSLKQDENYSPEVIEKLAQDIYSLLLRHEIWQDVCIYYNGKRMTSYNGSEFRYNGEPFIQEDIDPREYFEYVRNPHILSMSFEGPFYMILNGYYDEDNSYYDGDIEAEFSKLLNQYGLYYELGDAWNLTCCPN